MTCQDELQDKIMELTVDYTLSRYPDVSEKVPYEQYTREIALEKVEVAREVLEYFKGRWGRP